MTHRGPFQPLLFCDSVILPAVFFFKQIPSRKVDPNRFYSVFEENNSALL